MTTFYLNAVYQHTWISVFLLENTFSKYFPSYPQPSSFSAENTNVRYIGTRNVCAGNVYIRDFYTGGIVTKGAYIMSAFISNTCTSGTCVKDTCIGIKNLMS